MGEKRTPEPRHGEPDCQRRAADLRGGGPRYYLRHDVVWLLHDSSPFAENYPSPVLIEPGQRTVAQPPTEFGTPSRVPGKELQMELTKVKARRRGLV
jgi:hypothetical protein